MIPDRDAPTRVLILDDRESGRMALQVALELLPVACEIETVETANQAFACLAHQSFDLVFCDLLLSGEIDGAAVCEEIRRRYEKTRVVVFSGLESSEKKEKALAAGAFLFLGKPLNGKELLHAIETVHSIRRTEILGEKFELLSRIAYDLQGRLDPDEIPQRIVTAAGELGFRRARLYLFDEVQDALVGKAASGMPANFHFEGYRIPFAAQPIITGIFDQDRPLVWNDAALRKAFPEDTLEPWLFQLELAGVTWIDAPLVVGNERIGTLAVDHRGDPDFRGYTADDRQLMSIFAGLAAQALHNAELFRNQEIINASLAAVFREAPDAVIATDLHGTLSLVSPVIAKLIGHTPREMVGRKAADFYLDLDNPARTGREFAREVMKEVLAHGRVVNRRVTLRDSRGLPQPISISISLIHDEDGRPIGTVGILKEIPPPDQQVERYRNLLEGFGYGTVLLDRDGRITFLNSKAAHLLQRSEGECHGLRLEEVFPELQRDGFREAFHEVLREGTTHQRELRIEQPHGNEIPAQFELSPFRMGGEVVGVQVAVFGSRELSALIQTGQLMALGQTVAMVAHEINNPLNNIRLAAGNLQDLTAALPPPDAQTAHDLAESFRIVFSDTDRIAAFVRQLREFARPREVTFEPVSLNEVVTESLALFGNQLRNKNVALELDLAVDLPEVVGDRGRLQQVFVNLVSNALGALEESAAPRQLRISTARADGQVTACVEDSGPGVAPHLREALFEPFFTTKGPLRGTGLGLPISRSIAELHGGSIELGEGQLPGACFVLRLPALAPVNGAFS